MERIQSLYLLGNEQKLVFGLWELNQETLLGAGKTVFSQNKITEM